MPDFVILLAGIALGIPTTLVGSILAGELVLIAIALVGLVRYRNDPAFANRGLMLFAALFIASLAVYMVTDLLRATPLFDAARGWARFAFLVGDLAGIHALTFRRKARLYPLLIGYAAGQLMIYSQPTITIWKHHLCMPVVLGALALVAGWRVRVSAMVLAVAGALSLAFDTRAFGIICLITAAVVFARSFTSARWRKLTPFFVAAGVATASAVVLLILSATEDLYGRRQAWSNEERYASMLTAAQTIARHPLTGEGSWKTDFEAASRHHANLIQAGGVNDPESWNQSGHSQILQTWLEGGPVAALAFIYLLWRLAGTVWKCLGGPVDGSLPMTLFIALNGIWSCLFSPFLGPDIRINTALAIYASVGMALVGGASAARSSASQRSLAERYPRARLARC